MTIQKRPGPYQEMTTEENTDINGTWTPGTWRGFAVEKVAADWWQLRGATLPGDELPPWHPSLPWDAEGMGFKHLMETRSPLGDMIEEGRRTSGAINGEHRRDLKEAIIGAPVQSVQLGAQPQSAERAEVSVKPRRGV